MQLAKMCDRDRERGHADHQQQCARNALASDCDNTADNKDIRKDTNRDSGTQSDGEMDSWETFFGKQKCNIFYSWKYILYWFR